VGPFSIRVVLIALAAFLVLLAFVVLFVPEPWTARLRGLAALLAVANASVLVVLLTASRADDWTAAHAVAAAAVVVALVLAAYEWSALLFRLAALTVVLMAVIVTAQAGQAQLVRESSIDARADATRLDSVLARTVDRYTADVLRKKLEVNAAATAAATAITSLCSTAEGALSAQDINTWRTSETCKPSPATDHTSPSLTDLRRDKALAELAVDRARLAVARDRNVNADITTAESAVNGAEQQVSRASREQPVSLPDAIAAGGRGLAAKSPLSTDAVPVVPAIVGWILLLVAVVYAYRMLEVLNTGRDPGPVTIEDVTGDLGGDKDDNTQKITTHLRHAILANLPEPGVVPGAKSSTPVTDLLSTDPIKNPILVAAITFIRAVGFPPRGYLVRASLAIRPITSTDNPGGSAPATGTSGGANAATTEYQAHVRIHDARTKRSVWTSVQEANTREEALEQGGFAAAAWILCQARSVPPWLQFSSEAADALRDYQRSKSTHGEKARKALEQAISRDPTSGSALVQLGYAYDLEGKKLKALECYERAIAMFPEYRIARYRAAIGWSGLYDDSKTLQDKDKRRLQSLTEVRRKATSGRTAELKEPPADPEKWQFALRMAMCRFNEVGDCYLVKWLFDLLMRTLSVYERPVLPRLGQLRWTHRTLRASSLPTRTRLKDTDPRRIDGDKRLGRLDVQACSRKASWQLRYNLACTHGVRARPQTPQSANDHASDKDRAFALLRDALLHPDAQQLTRDWLAKDPDLKALQSDPQFDDLLKWAAD
jgi:tetratricopeptide (TPR) repeat protein